MPDLRLTPDFVAQLVLIYGGLVLIYSAGLLTGWHLARRATRYMLGGGRS